MGAGATAIAAAINASIPGAQAVAVVLGIVAGALAFMNGWLTYINSQGKGVFIFTSYTGMVMWGTSQ